MTIQDLRMLLDALKARRASIVLLDLNCTCATGSATGAPTCPCELPRNWYVPLNRNDQLAFGVDAWPFRRDDGSHGFRVRAFAIDADALARPALDDDARERLASALADVLMEVS